MKRTLLILSLSVLLFSCKKEEEIAPVLTKEEHARLTILVKENPRTPINILIEIIKMEEISSGFSDL